MTKKMESSSMNSRPLLQQNSDSEDLDEIYSSEPQHSQQHPQQNNQLLSSNTTNVDINVCGRDDGDDDDDDDDDDDHDITVEILDKQLLKHSNNNRNADHQNYNNSTIIPKDKYNYNYIIFYLLGMTSLLPWNFFITAEQYWMFKFRNTTTNSTDELTPIQAGFTSDLSVASAVPNTVFLILNAIIGYRIPLKYRMNGSLLVMLLFFIITTLLVQVDTDREQEDFFIFTLVSAIIMNVAAAIMSGAIFGISGLFPSKYVSAVVSGQALGGIFAAVCQIIALSFGASAKTSGFAYFIIGDIVLFISLINYIIMSKTLYFKYNTNYKLRIDKELLSSSSSSSSSPSSSPSSSVTPSPSSPLSSTPAIAEAAAAATATTSNLYNETTISNELIEPNFRIILNKIWIYGVSEWFVFVVTLSIYPSVTVLVNSQSGKGIWSDIYFVPVVNYFIFNTGDYVGRILAGFLEWPQNQQYLVAIMSFLRILFIPLLLLCGTNPRHHLPVFIHSDYIFIVLMAVFSLSNGYIANIALMKAPKIVHNREKEMASSMMAAFLGIGLAFGSIFSLVFVQML